MGIIYNFKLRSLKNDLKKIKNQTKSFEVIKVLYELKILLQKLSIDYVNELTIFEKKPEELLLLKETYYKKGLYVEDVDSKVTETLNLTYDVKLEKKIIGKNISRLKELLSKDEIKEIFSEINKRISDLLIFHKRNQELISSFTNTKTKKTELSNLAFEELKEDYFDNIEGDYGYDGSTYDMDIVRSYDYDKSGWKTELEDYFGEPFNELIKEKINEINGNISLTKQDVTYLNKTILRIKKYAPDFGYIVKD